MARRKRFARRTRPNATNTRAWVAAIIEGTMPATSFNSFDILDRTAYQMNALEPRAKLLAVYIDVVFTHSTGTGGNVDYATAGVVVVDKSIPATSSEMDPDSVTGLTDARWLWTVCNTVPVAFGYSTAWKHQIKQKVNLKDMDLRFAVSNSDTVESVDFKCNARVLISY